MTLEKFIKHNKGILKQINGGEEILSYLEELKDLREKYKNVSEAFIKVNNSVFDTKIELNKVSQENKNLQLELKAESESVVLLTKELEVYKRALELACWDTMCNCLHDDYYNDLLQKAKEQNNA